MEHTDYDAMQIIRSKRRTAAIQLKKDGKIVVRVPLNMKDKDIQDMIERNSDWIARQLAKLKQEKEAETKQIRKLTDEEKRMLAEATREVFKIKTEEFAEKMKVHYGRITIRMQKTRWGSCSSDSNLNFNCLLMLAPEEIQDYVVVHELCHIKQMNHSKQFWEEVEKVLPDYKVRRKWLKEHGEEIMQRAFD